jgi:hypothetical protein
MFTGLCALLLAYVRFCWLMRPFAGLCARLLAYVPVCWLVCTFANLCARAVVYVRWLGALVVAYVHRLACAFAALCARLLVKATASFSRVCLSTNVVTCACSPAGVHMLIVELCACSLSEVVAYACAFTTFAGACVSVRITRWRLSVSPHTVSSCPHSRRIVLASMQSQTFLGAPTFTHVDCSSTLACSVP